jgi:hypothetical protein
MQHYRRLGDGRTLEGGLHGGNGEDVTVQRRMIVPSIKIQGQSILRRVDVDVRYDDIGVQNDKPASLAATVLNLIEDVDAAIGCRVGGFVLLGTEHLIPLI